eukprot:4867449-Prymnesium_polylepis.1
MATAYERLERSRDMMTQEEYKAACAKLDAQFAQRALNGCLKYKGLYIKTAQLALSSGLLRASYQETLEPVLNAVEPLPFAQIVKILRRELDPNHFSSIQEKPVGVASVGQVHRATLAADGSDVAIKIRFPEVIHAFTTDLTDLVSVVRRRNPSQYESVRAWADVVLLEVDLEREAMLMERIATSLAAANIGVAVPRPELALCTEAVLVMSFIPGQTLLEGLLRYERVAAAARGLGVDDFRKQQRLRANNPCRAVFT